MKKLSEFRDEAGIALVAKLLPHVFAINTGAMEPAKEAARSKGKNIVSLLDLATMAMETNSDNIKAMIALLNEQDPDEYHCHAGTILTDVVAMFSDPDVLSLFGMQRQIPASSGSASESTEAQEMPDVSLHTVEHASVKNRRKKSGDAT